MTPKDDQAFYVFINEKLFELREQESLALRNYDYEGISHIRRDIEDYSAVRETVAVAMANRQEYVPTLLIDEIDKLATVINSEGQTFHEKMISVRKLANMGSLLKVWSDSHAYKA